jgi:hypothetical protein
MGDIRDFVWASLFLSVFRFHAVYHEYLLLLEMTRAIISPTNAYRSYLSDIEGSVDWIGARECWL